MHMPTKTKLHLIVCIHRRHHYNSSFASIHADARTNHSCHLLSLACMQLKQSKGIYNEKWGTFIWTSTVVGLITSWNYCQMITLGCVPLIFAKNFNNNVTSTVTQITPKVSRSLLLRTNMTAQNTGKCHYHHIIIIIIVITSITSDKLSLFDLFPKHI